MGVVILWFSLISYQQVRTINKNSAMFPKLIILLLFISGVGLTASSIFALIKEGRKETPEEDVGYLTKEMFLFQLVFPGIIFLVNLLLLKLLGMYITTFFLVSMLMIYQEFLLGSLKKSKKFFLVVGLYGVGAAIGMYLIFSVLLSMPTPIGVFGI